MNYEPCISVYITIKMHQDVQILKLKKSMLKGLVDEEIVEPGAAVDEYDHSLES